MSDPNCGLLTVFKADARLILPRCRGCPLDEFNGPMNTISRFLNTNFRVPLLALLLMLSACAAVPVQEMSNARQAVDAARKAGAEARAVKELHSAESLLQSAEQALQEGDYKQARKNAEAAQSQAVMAQDKSLNE